MPIRVLIADDHPVVRSGIRNELDAHDDIQVVGEAVDGDEALAQAEALQPDVLVLDLQMPGTKAPEVVRRLRATASGSHVLVLTAYGDVEYVLGMMQAGAEGYLLKDEDPAVIAEGVRAVDQGRVWLSGSVSATIARNLQSDLPSPWQPPEALLTERELEVLTLVAQGCSNPQISERLVIADGTVRNHISAIYSKLRVNSRAEAVAWAWQRGVVKE